MKNGFTLIELSTVLVIIGLLIGGVLVGKSLIESSKISSTISQLQQFDVAVMSFKATYKGIPGDSIVFGGDGDGAIEGQNAQTNSDGHMALHSGEIANFWAQAFRGQYKAGTYTIVAATAVDLIAFKGANKTAPVAKIGKSNSGFYASTYSSAGHGGRGNNIDNYYSIINIDRYNISSGFYRPASSVNGNKTLTPIQLLSLDTKIDDSNANSGYVRSGSFVNDTNGFPSLVAVTTCSDGSGVYLIANDSYECVPFIRIGGQAGNPQ